MYLHHDADLFQEIINETGDRTGRRVFPKSVVMPRAVRVNRAGVKKGGNP